MGTANGKVIDTQAQADTHGHSDKVRGGHAEFMVVVQRGLNISAGPD